jgi:hypothetical protein
MHLLMATAAMGVMAITIITVVAGMVVGGGPGIGLPQDWW